MPFIFLLQVAESKDHAVELEERWQRMQALTPVGQKLQQFFWALQVGGDGIPALPFPCFRWPSSVCVTVVFSCVVRRRSRPPGMRPRAN
jgi:hypothetical protein